LYYNDDTGKQIFQQNVEDQTHDLCRKILMNGVGFDDFTTVVYREIGTLDTYIMVTDDCTRLGSRAMFPEMPVQLLTGALFCWAGTAIELLNNKHMQRQ